MIYVSESVVIGSSEKIDILCDGQGDCVPGVHRPDGLLAERATTVGGISFHSMVLGAVTVNTLPPCFHEASFRFNLHD